MFDNGKDTMGFQIHNIRGEDLMTVLDWDQGTGIIFDNNYEIRETVTIEEREASINAHEFHFADNGTRALMIKTEHKVSTREDAKTVGLRDGLCHAHWDGFQELNSETWEPTFKWSSFGHVGLNESTSTDAPVEKRCNGEHLGWDFLHCNSVDKSVDGDYFLSARHTDTIYKISKKDGSIIWRLGGLQSDFDMGGLKFSRQHNIRFRGHNGTHIMISFLDNAKGRDSQEPTHEFSRGLLIALDEKEMIATVVAEYNHPDGAGNYAPKRGSYQALPNGNVFMGWSSQALQSEHVADGTIVMEARLLPGWLGSYRNYKFPFVGRPLSLPTVYSAAYGNEDKESARTIVHVSWNGATEVATWNFYKTIASDEVRELIGSMHRTGFETMLKCDGYASYIAVEGLDRDGVVLGNSSVFKTVPHPNMTAAAVRKEGMWLLEANNRAEELAVPHVGVDVHADSHDEVETGHEVETEVEEQTEPEPDLVDSLLHSQIAAFTVGFVCCATITLVVWLARRQGLVKRLKAARYERLNDGGLEEALDGQYRDRARQGGASDASDGRTEESRELLRDEEKRDVSPDVEERFRYEDS